MATLSLLLLLLMSTPASFAWEITGTKTNVDGIISHQLTSEFQYGANPVEVLVPDRLGPGERCRTLYVLPVETGVGGRYGDGLREVQRQGLHNRHRLICVMPAFDRLPWYADHPTDPRIRQESYLLKVVVPLVEGRYPVQRDARARLLLGFSKSGWGAWSLLLRHPEVFGRAAAWDAPLMKDKPDQFGMGPIFGTQQNFERYQVTRLVTERATDLRKANRLVLTGYDNFQSQVQAMHAELERLGILHDYRDGPKRKHIWESGWVAATTFTPIW